MEVLTHGGVDTLRESLDLEEQKCAKRSVQSVKHNSNSNHIPYRESENGPFHWQKEPWFGVSVSLFISLSRFEISRVWFYGAWGGLSSVQKILIPGV